MGTKSHAVRAFHASLHARVVREVVRPRSDRRLSPNCGDRIDKCSPSWQQIARCESRQHDSTLVAGLAKERGLTERPQLMRVLAASADRCCGVIQARRSNGLPRMCRKTPELLALPLHSSPIPRCRDLGESAMRKRCSTIRSSARPAPHLPVSFNVLAIRVRSSAMLNN